MRKQDRCSAMRESRKPSVIDLFAGAGFLSHAFTAEHFRIVRAVEMNAAAAQSYRCNIGDHIEISDVRSVEPAGNCDVLIGGPPCQGFSTLGSRDKNDPRNRLSMTMATWAESLAPKVVVIENVPSFIKSYFWLKLKRRFNQMGYDVTSVMLNAVDFGVPQVRIRCFAIASRVGLPDLTFPVRDKYITVREAWEGLPKKPDGKNGHYAPAPSGIALARMRVIPSGGDKRDVLLNAPELAPPSWKRVGVHATDVWGRMVWNEPSNTLRTALLNPSKGRYIHPVQDRVISLREAARLHSIPDEWRLVGTPYQVACQIGNGVPPLLGRVLAKSVMSLM